MKIVKIVTLLISILFLTTNCVSQQVTTSKDKISLDEKIGQMIMIGIGTEKTVDQNSKFLNSVKNSYLGGILIYEKNISKENSKQNLINLIKTYKKASKNPLMVSIDEEGGKVNRLKPKYGFPKTVSAHYLGKINNIDSTKHYNDVIAHNLYLTGFNVNYTPVLDVYNPINPVLGKKERCYSNDPQIIIKHARQVIKSHQYFNIKTVLKHFPGHGNSQKDSHFDVTDVSNYWKEEELIPYAALIKEGNVDAIMTAHIVNDKLDASKLPATLSKKIMTGLLREKMGFNGLIISDDMHMRAISEHFGFEESIVMCVNAGVDVLMFSNNIKKEDEVTAEDIIKIIQKNIKSGQISLDLIEASYLRILKFKKSLK